MRRPIAPLILLLLAALEIASPAVAARRVMVRRGPYHRTVVVVRRGWPLRRPARMAVVHPARGIVRVSPAVYLAPIVFAGVAVASAPEREVLVWDDSERLVRDDDWTEFTLNCYQQGTRLWLEIPEGRVQFDWAEVVFGNGDARVVDFQEKTHGPGLYSLLDFRADRDVDHVRIVARAKSDQAKIILRMEK